MQSLAKFDLVESLWPGYQSWKRAVYLSDIQVGSLYVATATNLTHGIYAGSSLLVLVAGADAVYPSSTTDAFYFRLTALHMPPRKSLFPLRSHDASVTNLVMRYHGHMSNWESCPFTLNHLVLVPDVATRP